VCFGVARGKRRGFSPGAAARHSQSAPPKGIFAKTNLFPFSKKIWDGPAELNFSKSCGFTGLTQKLKK